MSVLARVGTFLYDTPARFSRIEAMSTPVSSFRPVPFVHGRGPGRRRWLFIGVAIVLIVLAIVAVVFLIFPGLFGYSMTGPYGGGYRVFGGFLLVILVVWIVLWVVRISMWASRGRRYDGRRNGPGGPRSAVQIARVRYARGEITREQFEQIMQDLDRRPLPPQ